MAKYKTRKINGYNAVHIGDLPLKYGRVSSQNSMPYIREDYIPKLMELDKQAGIHGSRYKITSNIGGSHKGGPRSHANFEKMDIAPDEKAGFTKFTSGFDSYLNANWVGNGAIGDEGDHKDLSFNAKGGRMNNRPIFVNQPGLIDPRAQNNQIAQTGQLTNALYLKMLKDYSDKIANQYNPTTAMQQVAPQMDKATADAVRIANEQMGRDTLTPDEQAQIIAAQQADTDTQRAIAQGALANTVNSYNNMPTAEDNARFMQEQYNQLIDRFKGDNPYLATQGQINPYQIDVDAYNRRLAADRANNAAQSSLAIDQALMGNDTAAKIMLDRANSNQAEDLLKQANLAYQLDVANKLGLPPEVVKDNWDKLAGIYKEATPGMVSASKESMTQPQQNWRELASVEAPTAAKIYGTAAGANEADVNAIQKANQQQIDINKPGATVVTDSNLEKQKMYGKQPELVQKQADSLLSAMGYPTASAIQGSSGITQENIKSDTSAANNINTNAVKEASSQQTALNQANKLANQEAKEVKKDTDILTPKNLGDLIKLQNAKDKTLANIKKEIVAQGNPNVVDPANFQKAVTMLGMSQLFSNEEKEAILAQWFPGMKETEGISPLTQSGEVIGPDANVVQKTIQTQPLTQQQNEGLLNTLNPTQRLNMLENGQIVSMPKGYGVR